MRVDRSQVKPALILGVLLAAFGAAAVYPMLRRQHATNDRIAQSHTALGIDRASSQNINVVAVRVAKLEALARSSPREVPEDVELAALLSNLTAQIETLELRDAFISHGEAKRDARYMIHPIQLRFSSTFAGAYSFLRHVESMRRLVRFKRVLMTLERGPTTTVGVLRVEIDLDAFSAPAEAARS